ncbi:MAG: hypothetical protein NZ898_09625 [Myxococcota bacterium]|nr:hypothetical protein [Myxococcota bacterium]MDW8361345.1 hypothetical protein [Myxococcales bacterium]
MRKTKKLLVGFGGIALVCAGLLVWTACLAEVPGERSESGRCPPGERCSSATPHGVTFVGHFFFDEAHVLRLGPVVSRGRFSIGLRLPDRTPLPAFDARASDGSIFTVQRGEGVFGPVDESGRPLHSVDAHVVVSAQRAGRAYLRLIDPRSGELYDRLELSVFDLVDVSIVPVHDEDRDYLYAGCRELVGVRWIGADETGRRVRLFDTGARLEAFNAEQARINVLSWADCVPIDVPERGPVEIRVTASDGRIFRRSFEVRPLAADGLTECPSA